MLHDYESTRASTETGDLGISLPYGFLEKALTHQSILEGMIMPNQFLKIRSVTVGQDDRIDFDCSVHDYLIN